MPIPVGSDWPTSLATLDDVKDRLNIKSSDDTDDGELLLFLGSATEVLQGLYGDVIPASYTERLRPHGSGVLLTGRSPLLSVDSITVTPPYLGATAIAMGTSTYRANLATGEIRLFAWGPAFTWQYAYDGLRGGDLEYDVTYTAGRATVTPAVKDAVLEILRINWSPQRSGGAFPGMSGEDDPDAGFSYDDWFIPSGIHERLLAGKRPSQFA